MLHQADLGLDDFVGTARCRTSHLKRRCVRLSSLRLTRDSVFVAPLDVERVARPIIKNPRDVYDYMAPYTAREAIETFWILPLSSTHRVTRTGPVVVSRGVVDSSLVAPREVYMGAIAAMASSIILVHNHPTGDPTPSLDDREVTRILAEAGKIMDVPVRDHVIMGDGRYVSLAERGDL